ncbi:MAG: SRPBCC family protein, partial [Thermoanaerobaculia bacterium]
MSVKKDESGRRWVQVEVEVPGTPDEVWKAIATGPGVSSWFVPTEVRDDGTIVSDFGPGMESVAKVTAWDPPRRFAAESRDLGPEAPPVATEWIVEARSGDTCVVRVVHSLFASADDWDDQLASWEGGWPWFFQILKLYLAHFRGQPHSAFREMGAAPEPASAAWDALTAALGLGSFAEGQRVSASGGATPLAGTVAQAGRGEGNHAVLLRLEEPAPGIASLFAMPLGGQVFLAVDFFFYGDGA